MKKGFLFLSATIAFLSACQKDEHLSIRESGIVKGSWKVKTRDTFFSIRPDTLGYDTLAGSERVNRYRFFPNGDMARIATYALDTFRVSDSAITGKWVLSEADTRLTLTDPNIAGMYKFVDYNDSLMTLVMVAGFDEGDSSVITTVLRRQ